MRPSRCRATVYSELVPECRDFGGQGDSRSEKYEEGAGQEAYQGEHPGLENKGLENKGLENKGLENKGLENKGLENKGRIQGGGRPGKSRTQNRRKSLLVSETPVS